MTHQGGGRIRGKANAGRARAGVVGRETLHEVRNYSVETLDKLIVRLVREEMAAWPRG